jgi:hypothetical protein
MNRRKFAVVAIAMTLSLVGTALWAQQGDIQPRSGLGSQILESAAVITAPDIGFRLLPNSRAARGTVTGEWVVRVNGEWLVATAPVIARPAAH